MDKKRVLIIDDDPILRKVFSDILKTKDYAPTTAATGKEALDRIKEKEAAVALIDLKLGDMSGLDVMREIKERSPDTECIVITGYASQMSAIEAVNLGAYGYVLKPLDMEQLLVVIQRAIEKREAEQALRESEERYRSLVENVPDIIYAIDRNGNFTSMNEFGLRLLGYRKDEIMGQKFIKVIHPDDAEVALRLFNKAVSEKKQRPRDIEFRGIAKDQSVIWASLNASMTFDEEGRFLQEQGVARDITERKLAETKLKQILAELERSNAELEQFAYVASHDLQEPLRMVSSYVQLLAKRYKGKLDADADDFIAYAVNGAGRMQRLISDLLAYSRVGTRSKPFKPTNCEAIIDQVIANLQVAIEESGAVFTHDGLPTLMVNASQLLQLFQNLIDNSIKFRSEEPPRVHISAERNGKEWIFSVRDNGIGIDPEFSERIFAIFQRLHTQGEYPGTGIGLAICRKIIEYHGGRIWVEPGPGKGKSFFFTIPTEGIDNNEY